MTHDRHPLLAREGWAHLGLALLAAILAHFFLGPWVAAVFWLLFVFVVQFFRDPHRAIPAVDNGVLAPADGKIIHMGEYRDPYLERESIKVSIFMNVFSVHSNRSPVGGEVQKRWYHPGAFVNAALDKASESNERNALWIATEGGGDVVFVQVAGLIARRILCYADAGDHLDAGERYGFIRFGSRVDLYLPLGSRLEKKLGDWVSAGSDVLAQLPTEKPA